MTTTLHAGNLQHLLLQVGFHAAHLGLGLGALLWGVVRDITGVGGMYAGAAVTMALAAYMTWYVYGKKKWLECSQNS